MNHKRKASEALESERSVKRRSDGLANRMGYSAIHKAFNSGCYFGQDVKLSDLVDLVCQYALPLVTWVPYHCGGGWSYFASSVPVCDITSHSLCIESRVDTMQITLDAKRSGHQDPWYDPVGYGIYTDNSQLRRAYGYADVCHKAGERKHRWIGPCLNPRVSIWINRDGRSRVGVAGVFSDRKDVGRDQFIVVGIKEDTAANLDIQPQIDVREIADGHTVFDDDKPLPPIEYKVGDVLVHQHTAGVYKIASIYPDNPGFGAVEFVCPPAARYEYTDFSNLRPLSCFFPYF